LEEFIRARVPEPFRYWLLYPRGYADWFDWLRADRDRGKREKERRIVDQWAAAFYRDRNAYPYVQSSYRNVIDRNDRDVIYGFRCVLAPDAAENR
jgi:hypothetical protein